MLGQSGKPQATCPLLPATMAGPPGKVPCLAALVSQRRYDLIRRHLGKRFAVGDGQDLAALLVRELIVGLSLLGSGLAPVCFHLASLAPTLQGAR